MAKFYLSKYIGYAILDAKGFLDYTFELFENQVVVRF